MPNEHRADPTPPPHHGQGRGGSKNKSFSLRVSLALHPPERPSPLHDDMADHGLGRETRERRLFITISEIKEKEKKRKGSYPTFLSVKAKWRRSMMTGGTRHQLERAKVGLQSSSYN